MKEKPRISAVFVTDKDGIPKSEMWKGYLHYTIAIFITNPPDDTYAVTYVLDESYYDQVIESKKKAKQFKEEITSYGNYTIVAKIRRESGTDIIQRDLFQALKDQYPDKTPSIEKALSAIRDN